MQAIENINIISEDPLLTPHELKEVLPLTPESMATVVEARDAIINILQGRDPRLFVVVGPCSIHDTESAMEYAKRLQRLAEEVSDRLLLVMRVYFEKPRTQVGWQGLINDPGLNNTYQIEDGLQKARKLLLDINALGVPAAGEALDLITPQYVQDLVAWTAIGARTVESQTHRKMASGFTSAVGFKNATNGEVDVTINAIVSAAHPSHFLSVNPEGRVSVIRTKGNPNTHIVLRGGKQGPNYDEATMTHCEALMEDAGLCPNIMVDCSHDNSGKDPDKQAQVLNSVIEQIEAGNNSIVGVMLESHLFGGKQKIPKDLDSLQYGVSITDACIDWATTENLVRDAYQRLKNIIPNRQRG